MSTWRSVGSVVAGMVATVVLVVLSIIVLPVLGFATAELVGTWLPIWVFLLPLAICATVGGAITGALAGESPERSAILGSLATATGLTAIGGVVGLGLLVLMLGMTPAHGQETDLMGATRTMLAVGSGVGFIAGALFGAIGGASGHIGRQKLGD